MVGLGSDQNLQIEHVSGQEHVQNLTPAILQRLVTDSPAFLDDQNAVHFLTGVDNFGVFREMLLASVQLLDHLLISSVKVSIERYPPQQGLLRH